MNSALARHWRAVSREGEVELVSKTSEKQLLRADWLHLGRQAGDKNLGTAGGLPTRQIPS